MAKRRRRNTRNRRKKPKSTLFQWIIVTIVAVASYKVLDYLLPGDKNTDSPSVTQKKSKKPTTQIATKKPSPQENKPDAKVEPTKPIQNWNSEKAQIFLPKEAFLDNVEAISLKEKQGAILAYAQTIQGKTPGPKGETNTKPALRTLQWDGKKYQSEDLDFSELKKALGSLAGKKMVGVPKIEHLPLEVKGGKLFMTHLFFSDDKREVLAYLVSDDKGVRWAPLHHASGKKMPAAFAQGTTKETTRTVRHQNYQGKNYLIVEHGTLNEFRAYEGYDWQVQSYFWDGKKFQYDSDYSKKLTKKKRSAKQ